MAVTSARHTELRIVIPDKPSPIGTGILDALVGYGLMLGTGVTVLLGPVMQTLGGHPESLGHLTDLVTGISDLLYRFNLEFFCIAFAAYNKYLLFASIVTLSGIYDTRGLPLLCHLPGVLSPPILFRSA